MATPTEPTPSDPAPDSESSGKGRPRRAVKIWVAGATTLLILGLLTFYLGHIDHRYESDGAYIQNVTTSSVVIAAITEESVTLTVEVKSLQGSAEAVHVREPAPAKIHGMTVEGLTPDTRYRYVVRDHEGEVFSEGQFRTAPLPGGRPITFVALGDSGRMPKWRFGTPKQADLVSMIDSLADPDFILHLGDVVYKMGERENYKRAFFEPFSPLIRRIPLYPTLGNNDLRTEEGAPYFEVFHLPESKEGGEEFYSFDYGDVHLVCLSRNIGPLQTTWLKRDLAATQQKWKIVFLHVGPFTSSRGRTDSDPGSLPGRVKRELCPIFEEYGVQMVISGHDHNYERYKPVEGITYVVSGGGGYRLRELVPDQRLARSAEVHHFLLIQINGAVLKAQAIDIQGKEFDTFELRID